MARDPVRDRLQQCLWKRGVSLAEASLAIGRNKAYLQQYLARGMPRVLSHQDSKALGVLLKCDPAGFRHASLPPPKPWKRRLRSMPAGLVGDLAADLATDLAAVPEVAVEASAGPGAWNEGFVREKARWRIPEAMIRHEGDADPAALRILRVRGVSMEPELRGGDRLLVDTARRVPAAGELFVLWDGDGLVVKRIEPGRGPGTGKLRLLSANPDYPPYTCRAEDIHIVGRVVWKLTRM